MIKRRRSVNSPGDASVSVGGNAGPITTNYIGTQNVSGIPSVPISVAAKDPSVVFAAAGVEAFTGRAWLVDQVDRFTSDNPCGYVFVEAEAGLGKTAFAAWLVKTRGYISHFSRYSGGQSVRTALRNLSAQLITNFGLQDQAPDGILQEWAGEPAGFESLLSRAAEVAQVRHERLIIVVDGMDEADPPTTELSFGLPRLLPNGVYIVGTHRTGYWPGRPESPSRTLPIRQHDSRNSSDLRAYLTRAITEDILAARLSADGVDPQGFIDVLATRCDGVWVYLRYVIQELRLGLRNSSEINDLPLGLQEYYAAQIRRWRNDAKWHSELLPFLTTLGVAGEPLPIDTLAKLAGGVDILVARNLCDLTFRPLLNVSIVETGEMRFEIYHASFREILKAHNMSESAGNVNDQPYESLALAAELHRATLAAHSRVADAYLGHFGGLEDNLPYLAADPSRAQVDRGYALRHLVRHVTYAKRVDDLRRLLTSETAELNKPAVNIWLNAHLHANSRDRYVENLAWARGSAAGKLADDLPRRQKSVLLLSVFAKFADAEVAALLDIPNEEVPRELASAFAKLLEGFLAEEGN